MGDFMGPLLPDGSTGYDTGGSAAGGLLSGALQSAVTLGGAYLTRRMDIDLARRLTGLQPDGQLQGNQNPTAAYSGGAGGITLQQLMPYALIAGAVVLLVKVMD